MSAPWATVIGLGRLVDLVVRTDHAHRVRVRPTIDSWLAWNLEPRDLVVLRSRASVGGAPSGADARRHRIFHGHDPMVLRLMEWPSRHGPVHTVGLIESLTYTADQIHSPNKSDFHWSHQFGDRGERGHGRVRPDQVSPYPDRLLPRLDVDATGSIWIVRRPGNTYTVREWIVG